jgi:hypothetical protein
MPVLVNACAAPARLIVGWSTNEPLGQQPFESADLAWRDRPLQAHGANEMV